jgi:DNA-binding transcriptional regulator YiaG
MKTSVAERIQERLQGFAEALERGEKIAETFTCRKMRLDLKPLPYTPVAVKDVRGSLHASQAVFAQLL